MNDNPDMPPAKQSISDPNLNWDVATRTVIFLDGVEQEEVTAYDCEEGWVERHKLRDGRPYVEDDEIAHETVHGVVTVRWRDAP